MNDKKTILQVFLLEYEKLKEEQLKRIEFRDQMIYITLGIFGSILSFALSNKTNLYALLVIPWVCLILGWTYIVNDEKISAIGKYIRCRYFMVLLPFFRNKLTKISSFFLLAIA